MSHEINTLRHTRKVKKIAAIESDFGEISHM